MSASSLLRTNESSAAPLSGEPLYALNRYAREDSRLIITIILIIFAACNSPGRSDLAEPEPQPVSAG